MALKNNLIQQSKYTNTIDDLFIKCSSVKKKK